MTTLSSLRKLPQAERGSVLAHMVQRLAPTPFENNDAPPVDSAVAKVERELMAMLRVESLDAPEVRTKALRLLSGAIREITVPSSSVKRVRDRVGGKGSLPLELYDVEFADSFIKLNETLGISKAEVRSAVRSADGVEHYAPETSEATLFEATTLFVKHYFTNDPYTLIIVAGRVGSKLRIDGAWKSFYSEVPSAPLEKPVHFLEAFLNVFGFSFTIAGRTTKLIVYEQFPTAPGDKSVVQHIENGTAPFDTRFTYSLGQYRVSIALAFAIDILKYAGSLKTHGIRITRDIPKEMKGPLTVYNAGFKQVAPVTHAE
ncbi:hypothetical protein [Caballeronia sp. M23-90]